MIKNYTSTVPASKSVADIEQKLVASGAKRIMKEYDGKRLEGICFIIDVDNNEVPFKLSANTDRCEKILLEQVKKPRPSTYERIADQAEQTAWKILKDWIDIQMALIELGQKELMEIFLPYVYSFKDNKTYYEALKEKNFKGLIEGPTK